MNCTLSLIYIRWSKFSFKTFKLVEQINIRNEYKKLCFFWDVMNLFCIQEIHDLNGGMEAEYD